MAMTHTMPMDEPVDGTHAARHATDPTMPAVGHTMPMTHTIVPLTPDDPDQPQKELTVRSNWVSQQPAN